MWLTETEEGRLTPDWARLATTPPSLPRPQFCAVLCALTAPHRRLQTGLGGRPHPAPRTPRPQMVVS